MKIWAAFAVAVVMLSASSVTAQDAATLPGSSCSAPAADSEVFICPEKILTNNNGDFMVPSIWLRDERYGWVRLTACDAVVIDCGENYLKASGDTQGEAIEISLDDEDIPAPPAATEATA